MYILFDIGGTKTRVALSQDGETLRETVKYNTPPRFKDGVRELVTAAEGLLKGESATAVAGGIRGLLSGDHTKLVSEDVLTGWVNQPLSDTLAKSFAAPCFIENDAALAGLGEATAGAGKGYRVVAYHTVSTGVGGVRVVDGHIDMASKGFEPGKQIIDADRTLESGATHNIFEDFISGLALERRFGVKPYQVKQEDKVWDELALWLAYGLNNTIAYWSPDVIVLGGSMILGNPRIFLKDIERHLHEILKKNGNFLACPPLRDALLGDEGGLYGALEFVKQKMV